MGCGWVFNDVWRDSGYGKNVLVSYLGLVVGGLVFMIYDHDGDIEWFFFCYHFGPMYGFYCRTIICQVCIVRVISF